MFRGIDTFGYVEHIMLRRIIDLIIGRINTNPKGKGKRKTTGRITQPISPFAYKFRSEIQEVQDN